MISLPLTLRATPGKTTMEGGGIHHWPELQKRANRANQLVLFFLAGANFWEKHAKTGEKQALFWC